MDNESYISYADNGEGQGDSLRRSLTIIFKHRVKILVFFFATVITVTVVTLLQPSIYQAKSSILVKIGREYMNRPEVGNTGAVQSVSFEELTNSEIQILTNRELMKKVITSIGIDAMYPALVKNPGPNANPLETATELFASSLKVEGIKKSNVIQVTFRHTDPKIAAKAVNVLVDAYKEKHLQVFSDPQSSFLEKQLSVYEQKLRNSEDSLQQFKQQHGVFSLDEQRKLLLDQRMALDMTLKTAENSVVEQQKRIASLSAQRKRLSENEASYTQTDRDKIIVDARSRLLSMQLEEQELLKKYTENNRLVINIRNEIKMVTTFLKEQEEDINRKVKSANPVYQNVQIELIRAEAEFKSQQAKAETLRRQLRELDGKLQGIDYREKDMQQLKRAQAINEKNYQSYVDRTEEARIADDMNRLKLANVSVIEKASVPVRPVKPNKPLNVALGIIFGAMASLGIAFLAEYAAQSFTRPESVERRLGLPVLAAIPYREG